MLRVQSDFCGFQVEHAKCLLISGSIQNAMLLKF